MEPIANKNSETEITELELELLRMEHSRAVESYKSTIENGRNALRSLFIMNGGAAVAMAAFIGNSADSPNRALNLETLSASIAIFAFGVLFASLAHGTNYIATFFYNSEDGSKSAKIGHCVNFITIFFAICGYVSFGMGLLRATQGFLS